MLPKPNSSHLLFMLRQPECFSLLRTTALSFSSMQDQVMGSNNLRKSYTFALELVFETQTAVLSSEF